MSYFRDSDEMYTYVGAIIEALVEDPDLGPELESADTIVQYRLSDPEGQITVRVEAGRDRLVEFGPTELEPEIVMSMSADVAHCFWLGGVSIAIAITRGEIKARGQVSKILELVPLVKPMFPRYRAMLEDARREELALTLDA